MWLRRRPARGPHARSPLLRAEIPLHRHPSSVSDSPAPRTALQPGRRGEWHHRGRRRGVRAGERHGRGDRAGRGGERPGVPPGSRQEQQRHLRAPPLRHLRLRGLRHPRLRLPRRLPRLQCSGAGLVPGGPVEEEPADGRARAVAGRAGAGEGGRGHRDVQEVAGGGVPGVGGVQEAGRRRVLLRGRPARGDAGAGRWGMLLQRGRLLLRVPDGRVAGPADRGARAVRVRGRRPAVPRGDGAGAGEGRGLQGRRVRRQGPRVRAPARVAGGRHRRRGRVRQDEGMAA